MVILFKYRGFTVGICLSRESLRDGTGITILVDRCVVIWRSTYADQYGNIQLFVE